jgi:hypothetical protein
MKSTKVKNPDQILNIRSLISNGLSIKATSKKTGFSINTIRKIVRHVYGYEGDKFNIESRWTNVGKDYSCPQYISPIDGEILHLQPTKTKDGYPRISLNNIRETLHIHEAKKVFKILNIQWEKKNIVHHINGDKSNCMPNNLSIFKNFSSHVFYHSREHRLIYDFLKYKGLLNDFYNKYPQMKIQSLEDMIKCNRFEIKQPVDKPIDK